jgi:hypothetical protein
VLDQFDLNIVIARNKITTKYYLTLFTCMATNSMHLQLLRNLTSEAVIASPKHCIARRGLMDHLCSDNGSNFIGASREM